jgi:hypothetical protein
MHAFIPVGPNAQISGMAKSRALCSSSCTMRAFSGRPPHLIVGRSSLQPTNLNSLKASISHSFSELNDRHFECFYLATLLQESPIVRGLATVQIS